MSLQICVGICQDEMPGFMYFGTQYNYEVCTLYRGPHAPYPHMFCKTDNLPMCRAATYANSLLFFESAGTASPNCFNYGVTPLLTRMPNVAPLPSPPTPDPQ